MQVDLDHDLDRPADLTLWPGQAPARVAELRSFPTLRAALIAAAEAIALQDATPWIVTNGGDILASNWIRAHTARVRPHETDQGESSVCRFRGKACLAALHTSGRSDISAACDFGGSAAGSRR